MKIVTLYESGSTDGYKPFGDSTYFNFESKAVSFANNKHGGFSIKPIKHSAIEHQGKYYLLKSSDPVGLYNSEFEKEKLKEAALAKLSKEERKALGF